MGVTILPKKFYDAKKEQNELLQQIATSLGVTAGNLQDAINIANQASLNAQNKITELNENWNLLTTAQQQDAEVVTARQSTVKNKTFASLDARLEAAEQDLSVHQADYATFSNNILCLEDYGEKGAVQRYQRMFTISNITGSGWLRLAEQEVSTTQEMFNEINIVGVGDTTHHFMASLGLTSFQAIKSFTKNSSVKGSATTAKVRLVDPNANWSMGNYIDVFSDAWDNFSLLFIEIIFKVPYLTSGELTSMKLLENAVFNPEVPVGFRTTEVEI